MAHIHTRTLVGVRLGPKRLADRSLTISVHHIGRRPGQKRLNVAGSRSHQPFSRGECCPGHVWSDEAVFGRQQRVLLLDRFTGGHVHSSSGELVSIKRVRERGFID